MVDASTTGRTCCRSTGSGLAGTPHPDLKDALDDHQIEQADGLVKLTHIGNRAAEAAIIGCVDEPCR